MLRVEAMGGRADRYVARAWTVTVRGRRSDRYVAAHAAEEGHGRELRGAPDLALVKSPWPALRQEEGLGSRGEWKDDRARLRRVDTGKAEIAQRGVTRLRRVAFWAEEATTRCTPSDVEAPHKEPHAAPMRWTGT